MAECHNALKDLQAGKTPETDRLNAKFYKFFWKELSPCTIESFNYIKKVGKMSIDQRRGIMSLLPKKNKKLETGLTVLNVDYKIATQAIAKRPEKVLPAIIGRKSNRVCQK